MSFSKLVVITGIGGVHKMLGNRPNGLIVEDLNSGKRKFVSARSHQFTPLESISIYTDDDDTVNIKDVFRSMQEKAEDVPVPSPKCSANEAMDYLGGILPNYDRDQVYPSDVKKLIKWYTFLVQKDMLDLSEEEETTTEEENGES